MSYSLAQTRLSWPVLDAVAIPCQNTPYKPVTRLPWLDDVIKKRRNMGPRLLEYLEYEAEGTGIARIIFNRSDRWNALMGNSQENGTVAKVGAYMRGAGDAPDIRVIVLTGEGQGFCSGPICCRDNDPSVLGENFVGNRDQTEGPDPVR